MELIKNEKPALKRSFPHLFAGRVWIFSQYFYGLGLQSPSRWRLPLIHIEQLLPKLKIRRKAAPVLARNNEHQTAD